MTGATIVRWESGEAVVLAVHGAFDGASAWSLRNEMDESSSRDFVVDLTHAVEACDFAACLLSAWAKAARYAKRVRFLPGAPEHVPLLAAHGLEILDDADVDTLAPYGFPPSRRPAAPSGAA
jgi:hypothetical protein